MLLALEFAVLLRFELGCYPLARIHPKAGALDIVFVDKDLSAVAGFVRNFFESKVFGVIV